MYVNARSEMREKQISSNQKLPRVPMGIFYDVELRAPVTKNQFGTEYFQNESRLSQ